MKNNLFSNFVYAFFILVITIQSLNAQTNKYLSFISGKDEVGGVIISIDANFNIMEEVQRRLVIELTKIQTRVFIVAPENKYHQFISSINSSDLDMKFIINIPVNWLPNGWARDHGLFWVRDKETNQWGMILLENYGAHDLVNWFSEKYNIPIWGEEKVSLATSGGNILQDENALCIISAQKRPSSPGPIVEKYLNCSSIHALPCLSMHCHIDESLTIIDSNTVLTPHNEYIPLLKEIGYTNILKLPHLQLEPYANVLRVKNHIFFLYSKKHEVEMQEAKTSYESIGLKVIPILAIRGLGGAIHCMTKEIPAAAIK